MSQECRWTIENNLTCAGARLTRGDQSVADAFYTESTLRLTCLSSVPPAVYVSTTQSAVQHRITVDGVDNLMLTGQRERGACIYVKHIVLGPCCTPWVWHIHGVNGLGCVTALCRPFAYLSVDTAFSSSGRLWLLSECGSVLHVSAPVRRGAAADTRLGVA